MKRIDKIYNCLKENSKQFTKKDIEEKLGISAQKISDELGILRNNVSKELNTLCRDGKILKFKSRPVMYIDKGVFEEVLSVRLPDDLYEIEDISNIIKEEEKNSPFDYLIGYETSLKNQIEQAKAAIMYPPNGLHTLIVGATGVGKSLFANRMYSYAKHIGRLGEDSPFVVFNCADYYNNPQLLLSHIFGHVKGAFTGADNEKKGIVEKADGGILFLDEIHRLPPEGQEMIFYFMDTGTFNKLGESERKRKANVLIIGATTEDPASTLLKTFIRRIPITISIPSFEERTAEDKVNIIKHLLHSEAIRVKKPIKISLEAIKALIGSSSFGNIGQLKSNLQLLCAKGFLNSINNDEYIDINLKMMPNNIRSGLLAISQRRGENEEILKIVSNEIIVYPQNHKIEIENDSYEPPFNLYKIIEDKASVLREEGMDEESINKFITTDITVHIKCFYDKLKNDKYPKERLSKIVDEPILEFSEEMKILAENTLGRKYNDRFLYALSLHLSAFFNRLNKNIEPNYTQIEQLISEHPREYELAKDICKAIEEKFNTKIPRGEVEYITLLLTSIEDSDNSGKIGIVVAAHGSSTASSMVNVAIKLFDSDNIVAVDMPLEISPKETLERVTEKVKIVNRGKGVILLVDMGSLNSFGQLICENTGIDIKTLDMVSTPTVLEAARKSTLNDIDLLGLYQYLKNFKGYSAEFENKNNPLNKNGAIVTICSSGQGAALKLKKLVEDILNSVSNGNIKVIPIGVNGCKEKIEELLENDNIFAVVGGFNPKMNIPFISLESLISGDGEKIIEGILRGENIELEEGIQDDIVLRSLCNDSLKETVTYLNPDKIQGLLLEFIDLIEKETGREFTNSMKLRIVLHVACSLERMLLNDGLIYQSDKNEIDTHLIKTIKNASNIFKEALNIELSYDEIYYLSELILI